MAVKELTSADFEQAVKGNEIALFDFFATRRRPVQGVQPDLRQGGGREPRHLLRQDRHRQTRTSPTQPTCRPSPRS